MKVTKPIFEELRTIIVWIGLFATVPNLIFLFNSSGYLQSLLFIILLIILFIIWKWRRFVNIICNIDHIHNITLLNTDGDAIYVRSQNLLPYLWPIKRSEIYMSVSGENAKIKSVEVNTKVEWIKQTDIVWHGYAKPEKHYTLLMSKWKRPGTRINTKTIFEKAFSVPAEFLVYCSNKTPINLTINLEWLKKINITSVELQQAPCPASALRKNRYISSDKIPWCLKERFTDFKKAGEKNTCYIKIENPKRSYIYGIFWKYS